MNVLRDILKHWRHPWTTSFSIALGLILIFAPFSYTFERNEAHALFGAGDAVLVIGGTGTIQQTITATEATAVANKELFLDGIANALLKQAVRQMTTSIVSWINSGFQGSPAFVTDLNGFLLGVADSVAGDFISGTELGFLCSPFQLNIRAALEIQYYQSDFTTKSTCTVSDIISNTQNFANSINNWDDWLTITAQPQNNQYGALMLAQQELSVRISNAKGQEIKLLEFGQGFLSMKKCETAEDGSKNCTVTTPGRVIADQLNKSLGAGQDALISADEINEIVSALLGQLAQQAVTGANGLLGLSEGNGGSSYLDRVNNDGAGVGLTDNSKNPIRIALTNEKKALTILEDVLKTITDAEKGTKDNGCTVSLTSSLQSAQDAASSGVTRTRSLVTKLDTMLQQYNSASGDGKTSVYQKYQTLASNNELHSADDITALEETQTDIQTKVDEWKSGLPSSCR